MPVKDPGLITGSGNIWLGSSPEVIEERMADARALGLDAVRVATAARGLQGRGLETAQAVLDAARRHGLLVVIATNDRLRNLQGLDLDDVRAGGAAWGRFALQNRDVVVGFSVLNEPDNRAREVYEEAGGGAAGEEEAEEILTMWTSVVRAFAQGVRSEWADAVIVPGGLGYRDQRSAVAALRALAPDVRSGLLSGVGMHWYRPCSNFAFSGGRAEVRVASVSSQLDQLFRAAGLPRETRVYVQEMNVKQTTCGSREEAAAALLALLEQFRADERVRWLFPYSVWPAQNIARHWAIRPGDPVGSALATFSQRVRASR